MWFCVSFFEEYTLCISNNSLYSVQHCTLGILLNFPKMFGTNGTQFNLNLNSSVCSVSMVGLDIQPSFRNRIATVQKQRLESRLWVQLLMFFFYPDSWPACRLLYTEPTPGNRCSLVWWGELPLGNASLLPRIGQQSWNIQKQQTMTE